MRVLSQTAEAEIVVQRSRFLGLLVPVTDTDDARTRLRSAKLAYADATHVVHAFRVGQESSETLGCSDDGEPSGTAGRPVLDVLKGQGGGNALLLVVRWYGGTNLGTGGLVKAYSSAAKAVVALARWEELQQWVYGTIRVEWNEQRLLVLQVAERGGAVEREDYGDGVRLDIRLPVAAKEGLERWTIDFTRGRAAWFFEPSRRF